MVKNPFTPPRNSDTNSTSLSHRVFAMSATAVLSHILARTPADAQDEDATGERIVEAALQLFSDFGLRRTSMEDVARRAGVGRATIYRRFADKDELVKAAMLDEGLRFLDAIRSATAGIQDREEALVAGFTMMVMNAAAHPLVKRMLASEPETILPYLTTNAGALLDITRNYFREALAEEVERGLVVKGNLDDMAELIARLLQSLLLTPSTWLPLDDEAGLRRFGRDILRHFL